MVRVISLLILVGIFSCRTKDICIDSLSNVSEMDVSGGFYLVIESPARQIFIVNEMDVYTILSHEMDSSINYFQEILKDCIKNKNCSAITNIPKIKDYSFEIDSLVTEDAKKGKKYFVKKYFYKKILKKEHVYKEEAIINELWKWCIYTKRDDESGYLIIY